MTAEPGGDDALLERLAAYGVSGLPFAVKSDPEHTLISDAAGDVYLKKPCTKGSGGPYEMVQPALVVIDKATDAVVTACTWTWRTMGLDPEAEVDDELRVVPSGAMFPAKVFLVALRPLIADIPAAVAERRQPKLSTAKNMPFPMSAVVSLAGALSSCAIM